MLDMRRAEGARVRKPYKKEGKQSYYVMHDLEDVEATISFELSKKSDKNEPKT